MKRLRSFQYLMRQDRGYHRLVFFTSWCGCSAAPDTRVFPGRRFLSGGRFLKTQDTFSEELEKIKTRGLVVLVTEPVFVSIGFCY